LEEALADPGGGVGDRRTQLREPVASQEPHSRGMGSRRQLGDQQLIIGQRLKNRGVARRITARAESHRKTPASCATESRCPSLTNGVPPLQLRA
jgi:hypothetical protein